MDWVNFFIKLLCNLTNGFKGGAHTKPLPIGKAHSRREISNFNELNEGINQSNFDDPLKLVGLIPLFNYTVISQRAPKGPIY